LKQFALLLVGKKKNSVAYIAMLNFKIHAYNRFLLTLKYTYVYKQKYHFLIRTNISPYEKKRHQ